uniref:deoxycytidylate deaminase-like n=1 Tax=Semicossyphus pulcher TaxID=241346 RepID=UPI0037E89EA3
MAGAQPRPDVLDSDDYFMAVASLAAKRSEDPKTQVGACIVNQEREIVAIGYNRMPNGCDGKLSWDTDKKSSDYKNLYVCHAELNAIMNKNNADVKGCTIYVTLFPCNECAKLIIQAGIKRVVYLSVKPGDRIDTKAAKKMLKLSGVKFDREPFRPEKMEIVITFPQQPITAPQQPDQQRGEEEGED